MANVDLQGLIDNVLSMLKSQQASGSSSSSWYGGNKDEEEYWKTIRARNTALELGKQTNDASMARTTLENEGSMARQKLANDTELNKANIGLTGTKYTADQGLAGHKMTTDATITGQDKIIRAERIKALSEIMKSGGPEDQKLATTELLSLGKNEVPKPGGEDKDQFFKVPPPGSPAPSAEPIIQQKAGSPGFANTPAVPTAELDLRKERQDDLAKRAYALPQVTEEYILNPIGDTARKARKRLEQNNNRLNVSY